MTHGASPVGSLGAARLARVDRRGGVSVDGTGISVDWWVGADDRWRVPAAEPAVRQRRLGVAPAYETAMRVPGGDVFHRVYAIGGAGDAILLEIENDSPGPIALALVLRGFPSGTVISGARIDVDDLALQATKPAAHVTTSVDPAELLVALGRGERVGTGPTAVPPEATTVALLHPVAHRTRTRFALLLDPSGASAIDLVSAPNAVDAARGWDAMLRRGMQVVFADAVRQDATDQARADLLLEAGVPTAGPEVFAALEDWGLDTEAIEVWERLGWRARRRAARRHFETTAASDPAARLRSVRAAVIGERPDRGIELAPEPPRPGEPLEVHGAPTRSGSVSYAVRWHGARVALLWDVQSAAKSVHLTAPALDPAWSTNEPTGEVLLEPAPVSAGGA